MGKGKGRVGGRDWDGRVGVRGDLSIVLVTLRFCHSIPKMHRS